MLVARHKAVNILGLVAAADMSRSVATVHDGIPLIDVSFDSLVVDSSKAGGFLFFRLAENNGTVLVHRRVKEFLQQHGFGDELEFYLPENVAL